MLKLYFTTRRRIMQLKRAIRVNRQSPIRSCGGDMEELKKLEQVQHVLSLMQSHRIGHLHSPDSERFVASLILLLVQPCGLCLEEKCQLVSDTVPKLSSVFLQQVSVSLAGEEQDGSCVVLPELDERGSVAAEKMDFQNEAVVGFDAMQRANSTLEDFLDYLNEKTLCESIGSHRVLTKEPVTMQISDGVMSSSTLVKCLRKFLFPIPKMVSGTMHAFPIDPFRPLVFHFQHHGLLTERIRNELKGGEEYWKLERKLCSSLINKEEISVQDVMQAIHLKSFDYRVLNLLLFKLRGKEVNDIFMDFLSASEFLVEVADDLFDYEDDVLENNFNILRMFVRIYGPSAAPTMLARCITEGEDRYNRLLKRLDPELSQKYQQRCEEATKEGGKGSGPPLGTWNIPAIISDEDLYCSNISANMKAGVN